MSDATAESELVKMFLDNLQKEVRSFSLVPTEIGRDR